VGERPYYALGHQHRIEDRHPGGHDVQLRGDITDPTDPLDPSATADEAAGANGDSGGAVFIKVGGDWYLAGTIFSVSQYIDQPSTTSIYDNELFAVDLSFYRDDILAVIEQRSCSDGLDDDVHRLPRRSGMHERQ